MTDEAVVETQAPQRSATDFVRAVRNETQVGVGPWTIRSMRKGHIYEVPADVAEHLVSTGMVTAVDQTTVADEWFDQSVETDRELAERVRGNG